MVHAYALGNRVGASMDQKAVMGSAAQIPPSEVGYDHARNLRLTRRYVEQAKRTDTLEPKGEVPVVAGMNGSGHESSLEHPAESRGLSPTSNDDAERDNHTASLWGNSEQAAGRMTLCGRIAPKANAWGNAQDMQTGAR